MGEVNVSKHSSLTVRRMARIGILSAIAVFMSMTPFGYIQIAPTLKITFMHIPVIIAAIVEGALGGVIVGFIFGLSSLMINLSGPFSVVFINPMVSIFPRVMIGVVAYYTYKKTKNAALTAALGTLTNTTLVLSMIYLFAGTAFANLKKIAIDTLGKVLLVTGVTNGTLEIITAVIVVTALARALKLDKK